MKKVLSLVLVLTLVLGSFGMVFAAAPSDVVGHKAETSVNVLVNMGIINGYPDGTYKPEGIVTRAEMAKILVTALGLGKMASGVNSSFTDMAGHWADGVVAYAASLGMIVGYPDGSFKPDATVSYEEAATMMVRALGYDDRALIGTWPGNYVSKALALGLYKNVSAAAGGANRGDIALMVYELLDEQMGKVEEDSQTFKPNTDTMLKINSAYLDADDDNVADAADTAKAGFVITSAHNTSSNSLINLDDYIGQTVYVYKNKDNKIIAIAKIKSDTITGSVTVTSGLFKITVNGTKYDVVRPGVYDIIANGDTASAIPAVDTNNAATAGDILALDGATVTINGKIDGSKITPNNIMRWTVDATMQATTGDIYDIEDVLAGKLFRLFSSNLAKDANGKVNYNKFSVVGTATKLEDIKKDDIIEVFEDNAGNIARIRVSNKIVEGTVTKNTHGLTANADAKVTINGEEFKVSSAITGGLDNTAAELQPGATTKVWIAGSGKIVKVEAIKAASASEYNLVIKKANGVAGTSLKPSITVITKDNKEVTLNVNYDATFTGGAALVGGNALNVVEGSVVTYKTDNSGNIKELNLEGAWAPAAATYNSRTNRIGTVTLASNVVVFKYTDKVAPATDEGKVIAVDDLKDTASALNGIVVTNTAGDKILAVVVDVNSAKTTSEYAVVLSSALVYNEADDAEVQQLELLTADGKVTYQFKKNESAAVVKGDLIKLALEAGRLTNSTVVAPIVVGGATTPALADGGYTAEIKVELAKVSEKITKVDTNIYEFTASVPYEYYDETIFYVATFNDKNAFAGWELGSVNDVRVNAHAVAYDLDDAGEKYIDDTTAHIVEVVFILRSGDTGKTL